MLFVISGPAYVGKKTAIAHFMNLYSFHSIIPYTTREQREEEKNGTQYHFVEKSQASSLLTPENYVLDCPFDGEDYSNNDIYAYRKSDIKYAIDSYANFIIHASIGNAKQIKEYAEKEGKDKSKYYIYFLNYEHVLHKDLTKSKEFFEERMKRIHAPDSEFNRKFSHAIKEQESYQTNKNVFDGSPICSDYTYKICELLEDKILPKLSVMPTIPNRIPGSLSDRDIIYRVTKVKIEDRINVEVGNTKILSESNIKELYTVAHCTFHFLKRFE